MIKEFQLNVQLLYYQRRKLLYLDSYILTQKTINQQHIEIQSYIDVKKETIIKIIVSFCDRSGAFSEHFYRRFR